MTTTIRNTPVTLSMTAALAVADRVGTSLTWDAHAIQVDLPTFRAAVEQHCPEYADEVPASYCSPDVALTRSMARNQHATNKEQGFRWERVRTGNPGELAVELAVAERDGSFSARGTVHVTVDATTGAISCAQATLSPEEDVALRGLADRYEIERNMLTAADITGSNGWLRAVLGRMGALKLSMSHAQFFVTAQHDARLAGVEAALAVAGVALIPIPIAASAAPAVHAAAQRSLAAEAADLLERAQRKLEAARQGKKPNTDDSTGDLVGRLALFETVLGVEARAAQETLERVRAVLANARKAIDDAAQTEGRAMLLSLGIAV